MVKENKVPRIHCFVGEKISVNDVCGKKDCQVEDCMWKEGFVRKTSSLNLPENKTEAKLTGMYS